MKDGYDIDGVDMQYVLVQHRFTRSMGFGKSVTGSLGATADSGYSKIFSAVSAINDDGIKEKWAWYKGDTENDGRGIALGHQLGLASSFAEGVKSFCGNLCTSCP